MSSSSAYNNERNRALAAASGGGPYVYQLFSIMVHSGSASGGHYYAYIKDLTSGEWYCFNDQSVTKVWKWGMEIEEGEALQSLAW